MLGAQMLWYWFDDTSALKRSDQLAVGGGWTRAVVAGWY